MLGRAHPGDARERHHGDAVVAELAGVQHGAPAGEAVDHPAPALADDLGIGVEGRAGDAVERDVHAAAALASRREAGGLGPEQPADLFDVVGGLVVDRVIGAVLLHQRDLLVRADQRDHRHVLHRALHDLQREQADAAGGCVQQHALARLDLGPHLHRVVRGQHVHGIREHLVEPDALGHRPHARCGHRDVLGPGAAHRHRHHAHALLVVAHACANGLDRARGFLAGDEGRLAAARGDAAALHDVAPAQPAVGDLHQHFAGTGHGLWHFAEHEVLCAAVVVDQDCLHGLKARRGSSPRELKSLHHRYR